MQLERESLWGNNKICLATHRTLLPEPGLSLVRQALPPPDLAYALMPSQTPPQPCQQHTGKATAQLFAAVPAALPAFQPCASRPKAPVNGAVRNQPAAQHMAPGTSTSLSMCYSPPWRVSTYMASCTPNSW